MQRWFRASVILLLGLVTCVWSQETETTALERLDGTIKGIIVGLNRVTMAVLSPRQVIIYLHTHQDKLPSWVQSGIEVSVHYKREADGSLWVEQISPYKPPQVSQPTVVPFANQVTAIISPHPQQTSTVQTSGVVSTSRHGSLLNLRERRLDSRGLTSAIRERVSYDPIESEVIRLLPHYKAAAKFFNPNLSDEQAEIIAASILRSSIRNGVDPRLVVAVIACESSFKPDAVGKKGEIGLGQLKPETAAGLGVNPNDLVQNIEGCVRYLRQQIDRFISLELALAAYNAGPNAVSRAGGIPQNAITPRYVQKVMDLYRRLCGQ